MKFLRKYVVIRITNPECGRTIAYFNNREDAEEYYLVETIKNKQDTFYLFKITDLNESNNL